LLPKTPKPLAFKLLINALSPISRKSCRADEL